MCKKILESIPSNRVTSSHGINFVTTWLKFWVIIKYAVLEISTSAKNILILKYFYLQNYLNEVLPKSNNLKDISPMGLGDEVSF